MSRTVVLVHGAWHGAWCWEPLIARLDAAGQASVAVDLPSVSSPVATLQDDAACVRDALDALPARALVVGHSYGGAVVTEAGAHPAVDHIVYLSAFALDVGESTGENELEGGVGDDLGAAMQFGDGVITVDPGLAIAAFYHDCTSNDARSAVDRLRPQSLAALSGKVTSAAWREKPATYVVCTDDRALPIALQRSNAARIANSRVGESAAAGSIDWPTSHSPFLSRPDLVADLLIALSSR